MTISEPPEGAHGDSPANKANPGDPALRASDSDRERAASVLQAATADGRVSASELDERLQLVYNAKSKAELASIVQDLQPVQWENRTPTATKDVGIINDFVRDERWVVGDKYRATAVIAVGVVDLRKAQFTSPETTIRVHSWISTVYVVVPEDAEVHVSGTGIVGGFHQDRENGATPQRIGSMSRASQSSAACMWSTSSRRTRYVVS